MLAVMPLKDVVKLLLNRRKCVVYLFLHDVFFGDCEGSTPPKATDSKRFEETVIIEEPSADRSVTEESIHLAFTETTTSVQN
jgi:hypothetical protein